MLVLLVIVRPHQLIKNTRGGAAHVVEWLECMPADPGLVLAGGPLLPVTSPSLSRVSYLSTANNGVMPEKKLLFVTTQMLCIRITQITS